MDEDLGKEEENGTDKSLETTDIPTKDEVKTVVDKLKKTRHQAQMEYPVKY
jgi:hypothetical protein